MGLLDGKVVLVTGGAQGIGREVALAAAAQGAAVVVNDLGGSLRGDVETGASSAEATAAEIRANGGAAAANADSVASLAGAEAMVALALGEFGRLDAVVNPAGILRDTMLHKMAEDDWDAVMAVHLRGAFNVTRAAIAHFREQGTGSFVHFASTSGLIGNLGQANYAAAKLGVVGLSRILAMEGAARGVRSNVIAPFAWTRMTEAIPVRDEAAAERVGRMRKGMRADQVARFAVALAADGAADVSGQIFVVRGNEIVLFGQPRPVASVARPDGWTSEAIVAEALPALRARFTDLSPSAAIFPYDPI